MRDTRGINEAAFRRALLAWYDAARRELPWRESRDPYAIWVSEVMLQQTQVARVEEYWPRFLAAFPSAEALAAADIDGVLAAWSGLGYYGRARSLHAAAAIAVARGGLPRTAAELRELPGVGEYTAAAVSSIAFGEAVPAIDANASRVLSRVLALRGGTVGARARAVRLLAGRLVAPARPGDWNQAVMELGALVCVPSRPRCGVCPVARFCDGRRSGVPGRAGGGRVRLQAVPVGEAVGVIRRRGKVLLVRGPGPRGWWKGLWVLPRVEARGDADARRALADAVRRRCGLSCSFGAGGTPVRYSVTRHRVTGLVHTAATVAGALRPGSGAKWFSPDEAAAAGIPAPDRRALAADGGARRRSAVTPRARTRRRAARRSRRRS